ncbi:MmpS family transport accessory protein [Mycolicibacterium neoaurum]|uniref:MmpS family transport accessory protein n=1 Tax=Mycolicibacterium neoaurum TaxID=1795 RepID=UPI00248C3CB3|nr:MmpS family transport accessory protein [Mycolicibacterium neoaurum]WBP93153.1 MmpS family transport accessory protein [Mycolicibacterium neoaurum]WBS06880.1 MmpS family transport accessory protein [Mycolicibacterium neoaurum]
MTEYPRRDEPTRRLDGGQYGYPGYSDPAYAGQSPYSARPTEQIPAYPAYGYDPYTGHYGGTPPPPPPGTPEPPEPPRTPRWLWVVAGIAVVTVIGLVIALVIVNSSQQQTVVAPVPSLTEPTGTPAAPTTTRRPTTTTSPRTAAPAPSTTPSTTAPSTPGTTETVVYTVSGQGRAINITYVDSGGVLQTEFNVVLPWSKEVSLQGPANQSASVSIINVGREVTCSIDIEGAQVQQRTGSGLTICSPLP